MNYEIIRQEIVKELIWAGKIVNLMELKYNKEIIDHIIFEYYTDNEGFIYKEFAKTMKDIIHKLDFKEISFDSFNARKFNFAYLNNVYINPETLYQKDLFYA